MLNFGNKLLYVYVFTVWIFKKFVYITSNSCNISKNILPVSEELLVNCSKSSKSDAFMTIFNNGTFSIEALTSSKAPVEHWFRMNCSVLSLIVTTEDGLLCALVQVNTYLLIAYC